MSDTIRDRVDADTARALAAAYPAVGPDDDLTDVLDHWAENHTGTIVIERTTESEPSRTDRL